MQKINELLKMIEAQEKAGGETCTPGTELELGENMVDSYGKVRTGAAARQTLHILCIIEKRVNLEPFHDYKNTLYIGTSKKYV